ncbi:MAG: MFS transporter [Deltaproteobacteria bacterium]|nr:MFS transporter [Deltaproteobacteria bacterium]
MLYFFIGAYSAIISCLYFFLPLYLKGGLHFSGSQIGLLYGILSLNSLLAAFPVGVTGDRYPARYLTRAGLLGTAASLLLLSQARSFWPFLAVFWAFGLSLAFFRQSLDIMLFKDNPGSTALRFGHYNAWRMGGMTTGILAGGALLSFLTFPATLEFWAVFLLLLLAATLRLPATRAVRTTLRQYGEDFLTRPVLFFATWLFLFTMHWGAEGTSLGLFLQSTLGLTPMGIGLYMAGEFTIVALTAYLYGRFWDGRWPPLKFLILALATSGLGHIFMTYPSLAWSFGWRAVHGVGDGLIMMLTYTTIARLFQVDRVGGNSGLIALTCTLGTFSGSMLYGPLGAAWGYQFPLIISGTLSLALIPMVYVGMRE